MPPFQIQGLLYSQAAINGPAYTRLDLTDVSANPQYVLPPNTVTRPGQTLKLWASGLCSSPGSVTLGFYKNAQAVSGATGVGGAALAAGSAGVAGTNVVWILEAEGTFTAVGASGSIFCYGTNWLGPTLIPAANPQTAVAFDTTRPNLLTVGAQWVTGSATNLLTCDTFTVSLTI